MKKKVEPFEIRLWLTFLIGFILTFSCIAAGEEWANMFKYVINETPFEDIIIGGSLLTPFLILILYGLKTKLLFQAMSGITLAHIGSALIQLADAREKISLTYLALAIFFIGLGIVYQALYINHLNRIVLNNRVRKINNYISNTTTNNA